MYRSPYFTIPYERLAATFRTARYLRHPDVFAMLEEDKEPNVFKEMQDELDRRNAEEGRRLEESDKRAAEERRQREESDKCAVEYCRQLEELKRQISC